MKQILLATALLFISAVHTLYGSINDVTVSPAYLCSEVRVQANITPMSGNLEIIKLNYRIYRSTSVFIDIDMQPCTERENTYCATIPAGAFIDIWGVQWYIVTKDDTGLLQFHGTPDTPNYITPQSKTNPKTKEMTLHFEREKFFADCKPVNTDDVAKYGGLRLKAYYENDCGDLEENAAYYDIQGDEDDFVLKLYGDSDPDDGIKNGFYEGDEIILKYVTLENNYDYDFIDNHLYNFTYQTNSDLAIEDDLVLWVVSGIEITGNNQPVVSGTTTVSTAAGTDFGKSNQPVSHDFTITATMCNTLLIKLISLDDNTNFTLSNIPPPTPPSAFTYLEVGSTCGFTITYNGTETATATVKVHWNNDTGLPYTFTVAGEYGAGITAVENTGTDKFVISAVNRTIIVENAAEPVSVFDVFGRCISAGKTTVVVPQAGMYVVRVGETAKKVVVK